MNNVFKKRLLSFKYAFAGILFFIKSETNAKIHCIITIMVIIFGFLFKISNIEWCLIVFAIGFVLTSEAINTSIEKIIDFISPDYNKIAGTIKDIAAGGVLIASISAAAIGLIIFIPKVFQYL
jgi:diacylglycerol kinase